MTGPGVLTPEECEALTRRVLERVTAPRAQVTVSSIASSSSAFARGDTHSSKQVRTVDIALLVRLEERLAYARTNQLDEAGLRALVMEAEALARENRTPRDLSILPPQTYPEGPQIYFDSAVAAMTPEVQASLVHRATETAEAAGLVAAGDLLLEAQARAVQNTEGLLGYEVATYGELSVTARGPDHSGSGWAWSGYEDWGRVDAAAVIGRAVDLGERSANPVAVEPGRYTVILEPAAVAELIEPIIGTPTQEWNAQYADSGRGVFAKDPPGTNKIGLQMLDRRLGMVSDAWDAERPATTIADDWSPIPGPVDWFDDGVLRNLAYGERYARQTGHVPVINPGGVRLFVEGAGQSLDEMIASTRRGVWVNRFSDVAVMDEKTLLLTGTTRDGTFLIENGKITRPIKNFRFTESPFFAFNQLETWGEPVRASRSVVAPRLKLRDFSFTSLTDAV